MSDPVVMRQRPVKPKAKPLAKSRVWETHAALKDRAERMEEEREKAARLAACAPDPSLVPLAGRKKTYNVQSRLLQGTASDKRAPKTGGANKQFRSAVERIEAQQKMVRRMEAQRSAAARLHARGSSSGTAAAEKRERLQREAEDAQRRKFHAATMTPRSRKLSARKQKNDCGPAAKAGDRMHLQAMEARRKAQEASAKAVAEREGRQGSFEFSSGVSTL